MIKIALVSEIYSDDEADHCATFVGKSSYMINSLLKQIGIDKADCFCTTVFKLKPVGGKVINLCGKKAEGIADMPALVKGKYVKEEYAHHLAKLYAEIDEANPNVIITLGPAASWAFLHATGIKAIRGSAAITPPSVSKNLARPYKVLPTYHPSAVTRQWTIRPVVLSDLNKAKGLSETPDYERPERNIWIKPTLDDLAAFDKEFIQPSSLLSVDIETRQNQITCIGFAPNPRDVLVIPIFSESGKSYWRTLEEELVVWNYVRKWLAEKPSLFQNGLYDTNFLWSTYGIPTPKAAEDTMLLHHALQPEMEKGLAFLASLYTEEASWKFMSKGMKHD